MGKGHESFNKKERQKKKLQKRKDKEQRKEDRKSNSGKLSLNDMIAYVDENGNITSTPPDPSKKREIKAENIEIATPPAISIAQDVARTGKVKFFNESKGFGFIQDIESGEDVFVHANNLSGPVRENDQVMFKTEKSFKGLTAIDVVLIKP